MCLYNLWKEANSLVKQQNIWKKNEKFKDVIVKHAHNEVLDVIAITMFYCISVTYLRDIFES